MREKPGGKRDVQQRRLQPTPDGPAELDGPTTTTFCGGSRPALAATGDDLLYAALDTPTGHLFSVQIDVKVQ